MGVESLVHSESPADAASALNGLSESLPPLGLLGLALVGPYFLVLAVYGYHYGFRRTASKLRSDEPKEEHIWGWKRALFRPEGISAVVGYMAIGITFQLVTGINIIPPCIKDHALEVRPLSVVALFLVFDTLMWHIHWVQHRFRWLYYNTHAVHHTIHSPTIIVALTGYLPDTMLLILLPLHVSLFLVPTASFLSVGVFASLSLVHLHCIHSEFVNPWDSLLRKCGLVDSTFHHVHHLVPRSNLAHFFVGLDKLYGTYQDPKKYAAKLKVES